MTGNRLFVNGRVILPNTIIYHGAVEIQNGLIFQIFQHPPSAAYLAQKNVVDLKGNYLAPGYVDLHVHGGMGVDFMDGSLEGFQTICQAHARHGTTSFLPTTTVGKWEHFQSALKFTRYWKGHETNGARVLGAHLYGPFFAPQARGCHPSPGLSSPTLEKISNLLEYADCISRATIAPELENAEYFTRQFVEAGIPCNIGHSHATFEEVERAIQWGVTHVDHLFCAMSDRARLRQSQPYPMRGGVMEATLIFDQLTTEVIADGKHLQKELLQLAHKVKGPDRLAIVTDCNRALDMPDGNYVFGHYLEGEPIIRQDSVGLMPDGTALASGVMGMDHGVRTFWKSTGIPLQEVIRMATLTPARIAGVGQEIGSIEPGKKADLLILNPNLGILQVFKEGKLLNPSPTL